MDELIQHRAYELEPDTMTRAERILTDVRLLLMAPSCTLDQVNENAPGITATLLAIADDRTLLTLADVALKIGRSKTTVQSWLTRSGAGGARTVRYVDPPQPAYQTSTGPLWDADDVQAWMLANPGQCTAGTSSGLQPGSILDQKRT